MAEELSEAMECRIVGRLGREPEISMRADGMAVCRLVVVKRAAGPASSPARVGLYMTGELARRCKRGLHEGYLIEAFGELAARRGGSKAEPKYPEVVVEDAFDNVKLKQRAGVATSKEDTMKSPS